MMIMNDRDNTVVSRTLVAILAGNGRAADVWFVPGQCVWPGDKTRCRRRTPAGYWHSDMDCSNGIHAEQLFALSGIETGDQSCQWCVEMYIVSQKNKILNSCTQLSPNINRFSKIFAGRLSDKYPTNLCLNISPHRKYVATLPCEI